jgi:GNAT superfamily N-acetyltransferase
MTGIAVDEVEATLERPGLVAAVDSLVVQEPGGEIVAWAWVRGQRSQVDVAVGYRGLGLGTGLVGWVEERALENGMPRLAQTVDDDAAAGILQGRGYEVIATNWELEMPASSEPVVPELPAGFTIRPYSEEHREAAYRVIQDAFDEWQPRRKPLEEWSRMTVERTTFVPELSPLVFAGDELVGVTLSLELPDSDEGYVDELAVRRDYRGQGLARTMLAWTSRAFYHRGRQNLTLWTHSGTGALAMYERLGMTVRRSTTVFSRLF